MLVLNFCERLEKTKDSTAAKGDGNDYQTVVIIVNGSYGFTMAIMGVIYKDGFFRHGRHPFALLF